MGWAHGGGTPVGMLAAMLAAGLNANLGGRDHAPIEVERQVTHWMRQLFHFPAAATGLAVTGTSMANLLAVLIARDAAFTRLGQNIRRDGVAAHPRRLRAYASTAVHESIPKALDVAGLGTAALCKIPTDPRGRIDLAALEAAITEDLAALEADRNNGLTPFLVVATAGTVDIGAIDDLAAVADLCQRYHLWFHVDGAFAALAMLAPDLAPRLAGIERADSLAFDFHKWAQVPYDAGFLLVRDGQLHQQAFASPTAYLRRETRGMAAGSPWPCDLGIDLSRGFHTLKIWFTFKTYGARSIGLNISHSCALARSLANRIAHTPELELLAPVELNIVCFRYRSTQSAAQTNALNAQIAIALQEGGSVAPSTTTLDGRLALRAAIVNHRTTSVEIHTLVDQTLALGRRLCAETDTAPPPPPPDNPPERQLATSPLDRELTRIESQLRDTPHSTDLRFFHARLLERLGRTDDARAHYLSLLELDPAHIASLNNLGNLLLSTLTTAGTEQAHQLYLRAIAADPTHLASRANVGNLLIKQGQLAAAHDHFLAALAVDPTYRPAHAGLSFLLADLGDPAAAAQHRQKAFADRAVVVAAYRGSQPPIIVLELVSTTGGNMRTDEYLSDRVFQRILIATEFYTPGTVLPPHHLVLNAVGDADTAAAALAGALAVVADTRAPVLNPPAAVLGTGRCAIAQRLAAIPGVRTAKTVLVPRAQLLAPEAEQLLASHGLRFPLLLRSPGFHGGDHFLRADAPADLPAALASLPGDDLLALEYLDARGPDGLSRKYRVMLIDGRLYPLHAAISPNWKIHYFSADMADNAAHRAEDAAFLDDKPATLGPRAMTALHHIQQTLALDYGGIDFGLSPTGDLLLFEANATMAVLLPDKDPRWDYRRSPVERIYKAVWQMFRNRAAAPSPTPPPPPPQASLPHPKPTLAF
jgi:glutamate/tyrosine decarboxylase-like PLP-dependent enzyme